MSSDILDLREGDIYYSLKVEISDHTGTLNSCKLSAEEACKMLQCKVCPSLCSWQLYTICYHK